MIQWKDNVKEVVYNLQRFQANYKESKISAFRELVRVAFTYQAETYFKAGAKKGDEYLPDSEGDISRYTRRKTLSVSPYFSSKVILSRSGSTKQSLLDAAKSGNLSYQNEDVGYKVDENSISVFATSDKFGKLERARAGGGSKGQRLTTKKTWAKIIRNFAKVFKKYMKAKNH